DDGVDIDPDDLSIGPLDLGIQLDNVAVELVGQGAVEATARRTPNTELWAVPYDVNDNGKIGLGDLSYFVAAYGENSINANTPFTATLDFNHNGKVALGDLSYLASNYGLTRGGGVDVTFPESFTQRWVGAELDVEGTSTVGEVLDAAVQAWQESLGLVNPIEIQLVVKDFGTAQLGEAVILEVDENGLPTKGRVTIDDNGGGIGWSSQLDAEAAADLYDLYTVLLHEIGHTLGFAAAYDGFAEHLDVVDGSTVFVTDGLSVAMDDAGNHIADDSLGDDLMSTTLSPGVRKTVSNLDVRMLYAAYQTAIGGIDGYSDAGAALFASIELTGELLATTMSTAELSRLEGPLEGDVTWDRLLPGFVGNDISDEGECVASVDAFDWLLMALPEVTQDAPLATTYRFAGHDTNEGHSADEIFAELATLQASHQTEQDVSDVLLAAWDQWSNI
ncbi:MAG: hypothetical protein JW888_02950, partial [Pirellulales bacterium]|nr:hypothetical protein [Pirellulales bacterium]